MSVDSVMIMNRTLFLMWGIAIALTGCATQSPQTPKDPQMAEISFTNALMSIQNVTVTHSQAKKEFHCKETPWNVKTLAVINSDRQSHDATIRRTLLISADQPFRLLSVLEPPENNSLREACSVQNHFLPKPHARYVVTATLTHDQCNVTISQLDELGGYSPVDLLGYKGCD